MPIKHRYKKYELSGKIVNYFIKQLQVPTAMLFYPRSEIYKLFDSDDYDDKKRIGKVLHRMKLNNFISIHGLGDDTKIKITPFGRKQLSRENLKTLSLPKNNNWDGKWRMVMFDIPESKRRARNALSSKLKEIGFKPIQKSVFVYPFDCQEEVNFVRDYFDIKSGLNYMLVQRLEGEKQLKKEFRL